MGSVPSRFVAESMSSYQSRCRPGLSLPGEINQMCPALAGDISCPWELTPVLRCSFPFSFGTRFPIRHFLLPQEMGASLVLPRKSQGETQWPEAGCGSVVNVPHNALPAPSQFASAAAALNQRELIPH